MPGSGFQQPFTGLAPQLQPQSPFPSSPLASQQAFGNLAVYPSLMQQPSSQQLLTQHPFSHLQDDPVALRRNYSMPDLSELFLGEVLGAYPPVPNGSNLIPRYPQDFNSLNNPFLGTPLLPRCVQAPLPT